MGKSKFKLTPLYGTAIPIAIVEAETLGEAASQLHAQVRQFHSGWARVLLPDGSHAILQITVDELFDVFNALARYHGGLLTEAEMWELFQFLVDTDLIHSVHSEDQHKALQLVLDGAIKAKAKNI